MACLRWRDIPDGPRGIWLIAVDGSEQRRLTEAPGGHDLSPVVSPDGRHLAFLRHARWVALRSSRAADVRSRSERHPAPAYRRRPRCHRSRLDPDGRDLVFSSGGHLGLSRTARISAVRNRVELPNLNSSPSASRPPRSASPGRAALVYSARPETALYELALPGPGPPVTPVALAAFSSTFDEQTPHYSPDGQRLAFASTRSGAEEIWIANRDGSNPLQVTSMGGPQCSNPSGRRTDGRFSSTRDVRARRTSICFSRTPANSPTDRPSGG